MSDENERPDSYQILWVFGILLAPLWAIIFAVAGTASIVIIPIVAVAIFLKLDAMARGSEERLAPPPSDRVGVWQPVLRHESAVSAKAAAETSVDATIQARGQQERHVSAEPPDLYTPIPLSPNDQEAAPEPPTMVDQALADLRSVYAVVRSLLDAKLDYDDASALHRDFRDAEDWLRFGGAYSLETLRSVLWPAIDRFRSTARRVGGASAGVAVTTAWESTTTGRATGTPS